jgi:hypothetical protein
VPDGVTAGALERRTSSSDWQPIASVIPDGSGRFVHVDTQVESGERYGYRVLSLRAGMEQVSEETWVDVPRSAQLSLAGFQPNPAGRRLSVAFTLPNAAPARLELLDVGGRRIVDRRLEGWAAGAHVVDLDMRGTLPAGTYFVRLTHGGDVLTARGVVIR